MEPLSQFYKKTIEDRVIGALKGKIGQNETGLHETEREASGFYSAYECPDSIREAKIRRIRLHFLLGELYDRLLQLSGENLDKISSAAGHPLIIDAVACFKENGGIKQNSREKFIQNFDPRTYSNRLNDLFRFPYLLRPIVLLELMIRYPEKISELDEVSGYLPYRFFKPLRKSLEREIAIILPTLFPDGLISEVAKIEKYLRSERTDHRKNFGKYLIPYEVACFWTGEGREEELDRLYTPIKREIFTVLLESNHLILGTVIKKGLSYKSSGAFRLSGKEYYPTYKTICNFAFNQILYSWKKSKGRTFQLTTLSRMLHITPRIEKNKLVISHKKADTAFKLDSKFLNTTTYLPFCV